MMLCSRLGCLLFSVIMFDYYSLYYGVSANDTDDLCPQLGCTDACCHDMDFGLPYCCSKYTGYIYLATMVGGGVIVAILVIACYMCMKRTERELEAAARLEAAKAANNASAASMAELSSETDLTDMDSDQGQGHTTSDLHHPPPAYGDVMRNFTRCHSCDVTMATRQEVDIGSLLSRQHSEGSQGGLPRLPPLVDVTALIARHRLQQSAGVRAGGLPPPLPSDTIENKLPTYEECTSRGMEVGRASSELSQYQDNHRSGKVIENVLRLEQPSIADSSSLVHEIQGQSSDEPVKPEGVSPVYYDAIQEAVHDLCGRDTGCSYTPTDTPTDTGIGQAGYATHTNIQSDGSPNYEETKGDSCSPPSDVNNGVTEGRETITTNNDNSSAPDFTSGRGLSESVPEVTQSTEHANTIETHSQCLPVVTVTAEETAANVLSQADSTGPIWQRQDNHTDSDSSSARGQIELGEGHSQPKEEMEGEEAEEKGENVIQCNNEDREETVVEMSHGEMEEKSQASHGDVTSESPGDVTRESQGDVTIYSSNEVMIEMSHGERGENNQASPIDATIESPSVVTRDSPGDVSKENSQASPGNVTSESPTDVTREHPTDVTRESPSEVTIESPSDVTIESPSDVTKESLSEVTTESPTDVTRESPTHQITDVERGREQDNQLTEVNSGHAQQTAEVINEQKDEQTRGQTSPSNVQDRVDGNGVIHSL